jgi:ribose 1,5-bisphosphokinase
MPDGQGLVLVVGPSGVGKDAVIGASRTRLANEPRIHFVRRVITRAAVPGAEDHDSCDAATFRSRADSGAFALHWTANGLHYGLPIALEQALAGVVVANVSRGVLPQARERYPGLLVCSIDASPDLLRLRLRDRGRESDAEIEERLARARQYPTLGNDVMTIQNDGLLHEAAARLVAAIRTRLDRRPGGTAVFTRRLERPGFASGN